MTTPPATPPASTTDEPFGGLTYFRKLSVSDYQSLIRTGVLGPADPVELLEGYMVLKMPRGPEHDYAIRRLAKRMFLMVPPGYVASCQTAAALSDSQPDPDVSVFRGDEGSFHDSHPGPADTILLVEMANPSLARDTRDKARIYARAGVPVYWVVKIPDRRIEVLTDPSGPADTPAYATRAEYPVGSAVPVTLDGNTVGTILVADIIR